MNLDQIEKEVFSRKGKNGNSKYFHNIAHELEYDMLLDDFFSDKLFQFYMKVFSDELLLRTKGVNWFMFHIYNDFSKLKLKQKNELKKTIVNISKYDLADDFKYVLLDTFLRKFTYQDMKDMKVMSENLHLDQTETDIAFSINEMIERYKSGLMKDIN